MAIENTGIRPHASLRVNNGLQIFGVDHCCSEIVLKCIRNNDCSPADS